MPKKICIVDDDKYLLQMLSHVLEDGGFEILPFHGGSSAMVDIPEEAPDCVITDINMSGLDGLTMLKELRKAEECKNTIFIVMTATDGEEWKTKARDAGAHGYLSKPLDLEKLCEQITQMLKV